MRAGRDPAGVEILPVTKTVSAERLREALSLGLTTFGENRVQEAQQKYPDLKARHGDLRLHLIGPLQTNKVKEAVALFDAIETARFYIYSHPKALGIVQTRLEDVVQARNPTDPFAGRPEIGAELRAALRAPN